MLVSYAEEKFSEPWNSYNPLLTSLLPRLQD